MFSFTKRVAQCLSLVALGALTGGCAASMPDRLLQAKTGAYVFHHPAPDVESAARALLVDSGFQLVDAVKGGIVRTDWRPIIDDEEFATAYEKYIVVIHRPSSEHCRIAAIKISVSTMGMETAHPSTTSEKGGRSETTRTYGKGKSPLPIGTPAIRRDLDLEGKLISREEPERAKIVQSDIAWLVAHR